jgi:hypothetical protein
MKLKLLILLLFILPFACQQEKAIQSYTYTQPAKGKCSADTLNAYHYILPEHKSGNIPLLIILDSGGDGLMAVNKVKPAVSRIPCVVMGSDLVKNNYSGYEQAIGVLIHEACRKFPVSEDYVFLAGFSGGARMAFEYARKHPVKGVLMCSAGPSGVAFQDMPCLVYMIAGTTDFNFSEMYYNPLKKKGQQRFMADYFRGGHEWPPADVLKDGIVFLIGKSIPEGQELLKSESVFLSLKADSLVDRNDMLFAVKTVEKAILYDLHNKRARRQMQMMLKDRKIAGAVKNIESDLESESQIKQTLADASMEKDSVWWANEIRQLTLEISNNVGETKDHYLRIKGFIGILFFYRLNDLIHSQPANKQIENILAAYRLAEPKNPDVYYNYALYALKQGKEKACRQNLNLAFSLGFKDRERLQKEFPQINSKELFSEAK